jgi:hypothetical protein
VSGVVGYTIQSHPYCGTVTAPLLHDLCYEGMASDLIDTNTYGELAYSFQDRTKQTVKGNLEISGNDEVWRELWKSHIAGGLGEADPRPLADKVASSFSEFKKKYKVFFTQDDSTAHAKEQLGKLASFQSKQAMFSAHTDIVIELNKLYVDRRLQDLCQPVDTLYSRCIELLKELKSTSDKMRLIATYWLCHGKPGEADKLDELETTAFGRLGNTSRQHSQILDSLKKCSFAVNLDTLSEKLGTGKKKMVSYGYGDHRRRYQTEAQGDERDPVTTHGHFSTSESTVEYADQVSRFTPTLYWLLKDLLQVNYPQTTNPSWSHIFNLCVHTRAKATSIRSIGRACAQAK